jgi:hypothetical protein
VSCESQCVFVCEVSDNKRGLCEEEGNGMPALVKTVTGDRFHQRGEKKRRMW